MLKKSYLESFYVLIFMYVLILCDLFLHEPTDYKLAFAASPMCNWFHLYAKSYSMWLFP